MATTFLKVANNAAGILATAIDGVTNPVSVPLQAGQAALFPAAFPFDITIDGEIMRATSAAGDVLTCTRGVQGTTAGPHAVASAVELRVTAQSISDLNSVVNGLEDGAVLLAGRAGGQTVIGGTSGTDALTLKGGGSGGVVADISADQTTAVNVLIPTSLTAAQTSFRIGTGQTVAIGAGGGIRVLAMGAAFTVAGGTNGTPFLVFTFTPTVTYTAAAARFNNAVIFRAGGSFNVSSGVAIPNLGGSHLGYDYSPSFVAIPGGGSAALGANGIFALQCLPNIDTGWTVPIVRAVRGRVPTGAGTITDHVMVDIEDLALFAGTQTNVPLSMRSAGATVQFRHGGPGVFGANAAPTNASVGLEVQSTTKAFLLPRMTTTQRDAMTAIDGMVIYNTTTAQKETRENGAWVHQ